MTIHLRRRIAGLGIAALVLTGGSLWIGHAVDQPSASASVEASEPIASYADLLSWLLRPTTTAVRPTATTGPPATSTTTKAPVAPTTTAAPTTTKAVTPTTRPAPTTTKAPAPTTTAAPPTTAAPVTVAPAPSGGAPAATQTDLLDQVNARRATGVSCGGTWYPAVPALSLQGTLGAAAQGHANDLATNNYFSHTGRNGSTPADRITAAGYRWRAWAENIAAGQATTTAAIVGWFDSPGHCVNFMSSTVTQIGFGLAQNPSSTYKTYWVADMAAPF